MAHARHTTASEAGMRRRGCSGARRCAYEINTTGDFERKFLIGQSEVLLQICERKARFSALGIGRDEASDVERRRVDGEYQPIIVLLARLRNELQRASACRHF